jgi:hypothetical protein
MSEALPRIGWIDHAHGVRQRDTVTPRVSAAELDRLAMLLGDVRCGANAAGCAPPKSRLRYLRSYLRPAKATKSMAALLALLATTAVISQFATKSSHDLASNGSLAARGRPAAFDSSRSRGDGAMRGSVVAGVLSAGLVAGSALAQDAVQWRVEDGGNGHWYQVRDLGQNFSSIGPCIGAIQLIGATPCVFDTVNEWDWWRQNYMGQPFNGHAHQGLFRAPFQAWTTYDGRVPPFTAWTPGLPNNPPSHYVIATAVPASNAWEDYVAADTGFRWWTLEWSADCNSDGIVDFGQIRAGELEDANANNIPDCCEQGVDCESNLLVNGSFEFGPSQTDCTWVVHPADSTFVPGWSVVAVSVDRERLSGSCPAGTESWTSFHGEFTIDLDGGAAGGAIAQTVTTLPGMRYLLSFQLTGNCTSGEKPMSVEIGLSSWQFVHNCLTTNPQPWAEKTVEFVANSASTTIVLRSLMTDGRNGPVVDAVRLTEVGANCPADIDGSGAVNAIDLAIVIGYWGTDGGKQYPQADIDSSGMIDGADLATLLGSWGPCE